MYITKRKRTRGRCKKGGRKKEKSNVHSRGPQGPLRRQLYPRTRWQQGPKEKRKEKGRKKGEKFTKHISFFSITPQMYQLPPSLQISERHRHKEGKKGKKGRKGRKKRGP